MKLNKLITTALIAVGLVSAAQASMSIGGTNVVFITGSTAFRGNIWQAVTNNAPGNTGSVFDTSTTRPTTSGYGTSAGYVVGKIGGNDYILSFNFTGSEAGIAAVAGATVYNKGLVTSSILPSLPLGANGYILPNATPTIAFSTPYGTQTVAADLATADTSQAVSLTKTPTLTDYGVLGVVPFVWAKGKCTGTPSSSYTDLVNAPTAQLLALTSGQVNASFFTGQSGDTDPIYLIGRNRGSGTRVNAFLDIFKGLGDGAVQYALNSTYSLSSGSYKLAYGSGSPAVTAATLINVGNDGYESGGDVAKVLQCDLNGSGVITLAYLGVSDANTARTGGAAWLTHNGVVCNNGNVEQGAYTMWGHEHLLGTASQSPTSAAGIVAKKLAGNTSYGTISDYQNGTDRGAVALYGGLGGATASAQDAAINCDYMSCDKTGDTGYPSPF